ncbi:MAG: hypothetical protein V2J26_03830 [Pacificimonas sp.]|jgi:hypothetical protein|nr:hypothetical protein [Pacificimonas sp.]
MTDDEHDHADRDEGLLVEESVLLEGALPLLLDARRPHHERMEDLSKLVAKLYGLPEGERRPR